MQNPRREKQKLVKKKIAEILLSVREQKQHIENQLARNDLRIKQYCEEYEKLRHETDLTSLSENETIILMSIVQGLKEVHVDPTQILGEQTCRLVHSHEEQDGGQLSTADIIKVQQTIINGLLNQLEEVEQQDMTNKI